MSARILKHRFKFLYSIDFIPTRTNCIQRIQAAHKIHKFATSHICMCVYMNQICKFIKLSATKRAFSLNLMLDKEETIWEFHMQQSKNVQKWSRVLHVSFNNTKKQLFMSTPAKLKEKKIKNKNKVLNYTSHSLAWIIVDSNRMQPIFWNICPHQKYNCQNRQNLHIIAT